jgi:hypothetical protein
VDSILSHQASMATPNAANLKITSPSAPAEWTPGEYVDVTWRLDGEVTNPLDIALVVPTGGPRGELSYIVIASGIDPRRGKWTIEVPDVEPGDDYALRFSNDDPLTVYTQAMTITEPG